MITTEVVRTIQRIEKLTTMLRHQADQSNDQFAVGLAERILADCDKTIRNITGGASR